MKTIMVIAALSIAASLCDCSEDESKPTEAKWFDHQDTMTQLTHINLGVGLEIKQKMTAWLYFKCANGRDSFYSYPCRETIFTYDYHGIRLVADTVVEGKSMFKALEDNSQSEDSLFDKYSYNMYYYQDSTCIQSWEFNDKNRSTRKDSVRYTGLDFFKNLHAIKHTGVIEGEWFVVDLVKFPAKKGSKWKYGSLPEVYKEVIKLDHFDYNGLNYFAIKSQIILWTLKDFELVPDDPMFTWDSELFPHIEHIEQSLNKTIYDENGDKMTYSASFSTELISYKLPD